MGSGPAGQSGQIAQHRVRMESDHVSGHVTTPHQGTGDWTAKETLMRFILATSKNVQVLLYFANSITNMNYKRYKYCHVKKISKVYSSHCRLLL